MSDPALRLTETNSADDSKGRTWGLEGNLFWYMTGGVFVSVITLLVTFSMMHQSFLRSLFTASMPLGLTVLYVYGFRQNKPAGYDTDCMDCWVNGRGFGPDPRHPLPYPLEDDHV